MSCTTSRTGIAVLSQSCYERHEPHLLEGLLLEVFGIARHQNQPLRAALAHGRDDAAADGKLLQ